MGSWLWREFSSRRAHPVGWKATAAGFAHSCGIRADDTLWCWGSNAKSEVGIGSPSGVIDEPTRVGSELFSQLSTTSQHTCAIALAGGLWCWGTNDSSQLGNGNSNPSSVPQRLDGGPGRQLDDDEPTLRDADHQRQRRADHSWLPAHLRPRYRRNRSVLGTQLRG